MPASWTRRLGNGVVSLRLCGPFRSRKTSSRIVSKGSSLVLVKKEGGSSMPKRKHNTRQLNAIARKSEAICLEAYEFASEEVRQAGIGWYSVAYAEAGILAYETGVSLPRAAAIIAVLSPRTQWRLNLEDAWSLVEYDACRHALPKNTAKARRLLAGEPISQVLGGPKVISFWQNIARPLHSRAVTIDTWIARAVGVSEAQLKLWGVYEAISRGVSGAAEKVGILPSQMQAILWVVTRIKAGIERDLEEQSWATTRPNPMEVYA